MMNNILVVKDKINDYEDECVKICNNEIIFKKNCDYDINYSLCENINLKIVLLDNVCVRLFEFMSDSKINSNVIYELSDNARLILYKFYSNDSVRENVSINLNGYMSRIDYNFSNICKVEEKYNIRVSHNNSNSISNISNKSICLKDGKIDYTIDSIVERGNICCNLNQNTRIINFGENNSVIRPNMFISEDNIEARHGSVIGSFNEDDLFYLMSRGIEYNESIKLLVKGFIFSNLSVDINKRSKILDIINKYWR